MSFTKNNSFTFVADKNTSSELWYRGPALYVLSQCKEYKYITPIYHFTASISSCLQCPSLSHQPLHVPTPMNLLCAVPLFLLPGSSFFKILCIVYPTSALRSCSNHLSLRCSFNLVNSNVKWKRNKVFPSFLRHPLTLQECVNQSG